MKTFHVQFQKKRMLGLILIAFAAVLVFFGIWHLKKEKEMYLSIQGVSRITISTMPPTADIRENLQLRDPEDIDSLVHYFNHIPIKATKKRDTYCGMGYLVVLDSDKESVKISFNSEEFITVNGERYKISGENVTDFDEVLGNIILKNYRNGHKENFLTGRVTTVFMKEDGESKKEVCILDKDKREIDIMDSYVYDTRTNETTYVRKGDYVEVYLEHNSQSAEAVFICQGEEPLQ